MQERLWEALLWRIHNITREGILSPTALSIGYSAYPDPDDDFQRCIESACKVSRVFGKERSVRQAASENAESLSERAYRLGIPYLSLLPRQTSQKMWHLMKPQLAQELCCYPLGCERNILTVAMADPQNQQVLARLERETGLHIFPVLAPVQELQAVLEQLV
ncbi:MAG: hypothetical protein IMW89_19980 [Ktedonobacteraceae bacterium]|nr:hypothetical protein [Ktedonobacteraceae bacterium]